MAGNRPGVRSAYHVAAEEARKAGRNAPTLDEVRAHCPTLSASFVQGVLEREGRLVMAGSPTRPDGWSSEAAYVRECITDGMYSGSPFTRVRLGDEPGVHNL